MCGQEADHGQVGQYFFPLQLLREMDGHSGFINTICFDLAGTKLKVSK